MKVGISYNLKRSQNRYIFPREGLTVDERTVQQALTGVRPKRVKGTRARRKAGTAQRRRAEDITENLYRILRSAWRSEAARAAIQMIREVKKDTRMTTGSIAAIGDKIGHPSAKAVIVNLARSGSKTRRGRFETAQEAKGFSEWLPEATKSFGQGRKFGKQGAKVGVGSAFRPIFNFQWNYVTLQHVLMDIGKPSNIFPTPLQTVDRAEVEFIESVKEIWAREGLDILRFWIENGETAAARKGALLARQREQQGHKTGRKREFF